MDIIATERGGKNFALPDLCILSSMKTNRKLKQHGDVLDELRTAAMQFLKQQRMKFRQHICFQTASSPPPSRPNHLKTNGNLTCLS